MNIYRSFAERSNVAETGQEAVKEEETNGKEVADNDPEYVIVERLNFFYCLICTWCVQMKMRMFNYLDNQAPNQFSYEVQNCSAGIFTLGIRETGSICATEQS